MALFSEMQRRNVFRVALLYIVSSWLLLQVADIGVSLLGLPEWSGRFIFLLLVIGFPLVMVFSWVYEITPDGIKRETEVPNDASLVAVSGRKLNTAVIVLLLLALGGLVADRLIPGRQAGVGSEGAAATDSSARHEHSIAVLPFINMSADSENDYFSDGLSEELLNLLAKVPQLQVAARTSAFSFKGTAADIEQIANSLNVAHVLEGSVRKSGDSIRITAQLIKASTGYQLWSQSWARELTDVFAIQDEIAAAVVAELKVAILGDAPRARVTDMRAYDLYLQAKALANLSTDEAFEEAILLLKESVSLDPAFAAAWAELGTVQVNRIGRGFAASEADIKLALAANNRALAINADNAQALSGLGWIAMFYEWDFQKAAGLIDRAREIEPRNVKALNSAAALAGTFGQRAKQILLLEIAREQDPLSHTVLHNLVMAYSNDGRIEDAFSVLDDMREVEPNSFMLAIDDAWMAWFVRDANSALEKFNNLGGSIGLWGRVFALHDLGRMNEIDDAMQRLRDSDARPLQIAAAYAYIGDNDSAFAEFERAYATRDKWLIEIRGFSFLDSLSADPRWEPLLQKIGVSDADARRLDN